MQIIRIQQWQKVLEAVGIGYASGRGGCFGGCCTRSVCGNCRIGLSNSAGAVEALGPITLAHILDPDFSPRGRGMDESVLAQVNAYMRVATPQGIEEDEIAGLQRMSLYCCPDPADIPRGAWQDQAQGFAKDMTYQSAAVKSGFRGFPSAPITYTNEAQGTNGQFLGIDCIAFKEG